MYNGVMMMYHDKCTVTKHIFLTLKNKLNFYVPIYTIETTR